MEYYRRVLPLCYADSAVVPRGRVEEHAVVVERGDGFERVCGVDEEGVCLLYVDGRRWPGAIDADDPTGRETIWVDVLDVGEVPPNFMDSSEGMGGCEEGREKVDRPHGGCFADLSDYPRFKTEEKRTSRYRLI